MNFNQLENALSSSITFLLKTSREKGLTVTSEMNFKAKLHVFSSLIKQEYAQKKLALNEKDFDALIKMCCKSEELRNQLLHSSWVYDHSKRSLETRRRKLSAKIKSGFKIHEEPLTAGQVLDIADYIICTAMAVEEFFVACYEDYKSALEYVVRS